MPQRLPVLLLEPQTGVSLLSIPDLRGLIPRRPLQMVQIRMCLTRRYGFRQTIKKPNSIIRYPMVRVEILHLRQHSQHPDRTDKLKSMKLPMPQPVFLMSRIVVPEPQSVP